jgi:hypothetical protein
VGEGNRHAHLPPGSSHPENYAPSIALKL